MKSTPEFHSNHVSSRLCHFLGFSCESHVDTERKFSYCSCISNKKRTLIKLFAFMLLTKLSSVMATEKELRCVPVRVAFIYQSAAALCAIQKTFFHLTSSIIDILITNVGECGHIQSLSLSLIDLYEIFGTWLNLICDFLIPIGLNSTLEFRNMFSLVCVLCNYVLSFFGFWANKFGTKFKLHFHFCSTQQFSQFSFSHSHFTTFLCLYVCCSWKIQVNNRGCLNVPASSSAGISTALMLTL